MAAAKTKTGGTRKAAGAKTAPKKTAARKSTAKRKTQTKGSSSARKTIPVPEPKTPVYNFSLLKEILVIAAFGFSIVLFASCFQKPGSSLYWLQDAVFFLFGYASYLIPFLFFFAVCYLVVNYGKRGLWFRMTSILLFVIAASGVSYLTTFQGGLLGNSVIGILNPALGPLGSYIVMVVLALVGLVMLTGHSLVSDMRDNSRKAYEAVKQKQERLKGDHEVRVSERRLERERENTQRLQEQRRRLEELQAAREQEIAARKEWERAVVRGIGDTIVEPDDTFDFSAVSGKKGGKKAEKKNVSSDEAFYGEIHFGGEYPENEDILSGRHDSRTESELEELDAEAAVDEYAAETNRRHQLPDETELPDELPWEPEREFSVSEEDIISHAVSRESGRRKEEMPEPEIFIAEEKQEEEQEDRSMYPSEDPIPQMRVDMVWEGEEPSDSGQSSSEGPYRQELPPDPIPDPAAAGQTPDAVFERKNTYSNTSAQEMSEENRTKTVRTSTGKVITVELDGLPGEKKQPADVKKRTIEEDEGRIVPEEYIEPKEYVFPSLQMLKRGTAGGSSREETARRLKETAMKLQQTLQNFGVGVTVTNISCGPSVTRYELQPEQGVKVSRIVSLTDDIKLNLAAEDIRMEAPIPGKAAIGIEVPNKEKQSVMLRDLLESEEFKKHPSKVVFAAGKDIAGSVILADIAKMPHLLIAGATGSGKSVCINTIIMSILYKARPSEVKLIMIDPKVVELSIYNGIPHLLIPVVTDPKKAAGALNWAVTEMTDRYQKFAQYKVRDMKSYNEKVDAVTREGQDSKDAPKKMPQIVIIVDELADLMMVAPGDVEEAICRLAQMARAAGIHLVIATQRPSVNVITGLIKANVPSRIAFSVTSGTDSRTIIDMNGAEKLLGKGDMLFYPSGYPKPLRVQGCFVSDEEVQEVVKFLAEQKNVIGGGQDKNISLDSASAEAQGGSRGGSERDEYFEQAGRFIIEKEKASIGMLQRMFKIGFNRAARIMDQLASAGVVSEEEGTKPRRVLMTMEEFEQL